MDVDCPLHLRQRSPRLWTNPLLASSQGVTIHRVMGLRAPSLAAAGPEHHDYNYNDSERSIGCYDKLETRRALAWLSHAQISLCNTYTRGVPCIREICLAAAARSLLCLVFITYTLVRVNEAAITLRHRPGRGHSLSADLDIFPLSLQHLQHHFIIFSLVQSDALKICSASSSSILKIDAGVESAFRHQRLIVSLWRLPAQRGAPT